MLLKSGKLYILSGIPGSGKSELLKRNIEKGNILPEMVISSDAIRTSLVGKLFRINTRKEAAERIHEGSNPTVWTIVEKMLREKMKEKLTVFLDSTAISDKERKDFVAIAKEYHMETEILIIDETLETSKSRNQNRSVNIDEYVLEDFNGRFQKDSQFPFSLITSETEITLVPNTIPSDVELDVIGDVHGLYDLLLNLISKLGYTLENGVPVHPQGRRLLFLGDWIDRGPNSVETMLFVKKAVEAGHFAIAGNHELKLVRNIERGTEEPKGSHAVLKTYVDLIQHGVNLKEIASFLKSLPGYYIQDEFAFCHAHIGYFNPLKTPFSEMVYGSYPFKNYDSDEEYDSLYKKGINKHILIRGHIEQITPQEAVFSLEQKQAFKGDLVSLNIQKMKEAIKNGSSNFEAFEQSLTKEKSEFDYGEYLKTVSLDHHLKNLQKDKLVTSRSDDSGMLRIVKYSKQVFFDNLWAQGGIPLMKARGIILDVSGQIVQHPFDKVFNYSENDAGLDIPNDETVQYVEKMNGFLGNITLNLFTKELLVSTTGSFDSEFVGYIKDFLDPKKEGMLKKYLSKNNVTLSFEVIHPNDPHIIEYSEDEKGLYLIGVRGKKQNDINWEESDVDEVAKILEFKRPEHGFCSFGELKEKVKTSQKEGFMVRRSVDGKNIHVLKFKSPFYSTTKFVGRLSDKNISFMFGNPNKFKEKMAEEEFFPLVDKITSSFQKEEFANMSNEERVVIVRDIVLDIIK